MEGKIQFPLKEAEQLADAALRRLGYNGHEAARIGHHLIDSELRGFGIAGLARILSIADRLGGRKPATSTKITREAAATAQIDGQDTLGYLVGYEATELAIKKCKEVGLSCVGANGTYYTGMLSYYAEMAAAENLVTVIASHCTAWVAPEGPYKPLAVIYDIGNSKIIHAQVMLARRLGEELNPDTAYDANGDMTTDPHEALSGALAVWGGATGSGLALLGIVAGAPALPPDLENFGFLVMMINPAMFSPLEEFKSDVDKMIDAWHNAPSTSGSPMRVPFERSNRLRAERRASGYIEVESGVIERLRTLVSSYK